MGQPVVESRSDGICMAGHAWAGMQVIQRSSPEFFTHNQTGHSNAKAVVLVVDDSATMRALLSRMLRALGYEVVAAQDGHEALTVVQQRAIDVIVSDLHMDGLDGLGLLRVLKERGQLDTLPVLVLSGDFEASSAIECIKAGAIDYLSKPINEHLLAARLESCLARSASDARIRSYVAMLSAERARSVALLRSIVPDAIATRLEAGEVQIAERYADVSVAFIDLVGFTSFSQAHAAEYVVSTLDSYFRRIDTIARDYGIEKIKTIGDGYMAAAGIPRPQLNHGEALLEFALAICRDANHRKSQGLPASALRIGLARGPVVAGVIGELRPIWDLWGDTVNLAARLESKSSVNSVLVSESFYQQLPSGWSQASIEQVELKGIGSQVAYRFQPAMRERRRKSALSRTGVVDRSMAMREADHAVRRSGMIDLVTGALNEDGVRAALALVVERGRGVLVWVAVRVEAADGLLVEHANLTLVAQEARALFRADDLIARTGHTIWAIVAPGDGFSAQTAVDRLSRRLAARQQHLGQNASRMVVAAGEITAGSSDIARFLGGEYRFVADERQESSDQGPVPLVQVELVGAQIRVLATDNETTATGSK